MTDEMIERVARAIYEGVTDPAKQPRIGGLPPVKWPAWEDVTAKDSYRDAARAAIAAMKTPTEAMIWAGRQADDAAFFTEDIWCAMISAALGEKGGGT